MSRTRYASLTALCLTLGLAVSACSSPSSTPAVSASTASTNTEATLRAWQLEPRSFPIERSTAVPGLTNHGQESLAEPRVSVAWPELSDSPDFSQMLRDSTQGAVDSFSEDAPPPSENIKPSFEQFWTVAQNTPTTLAVTLDRHTFLGASTDTTFLTYVLDRKAGTTSTGSALVAPAHSREVVALARQALAPNGATPLPSESSMTDDDVAALLDSASISTSGNLVLVSSTGLLLPYSSGPWAVSIPAAQVRGLLSPLGQRAQDEAGTAMPPGTAGPGKAGESPEISIGATGGPQATDAVASTASSDPAVATPAIDSVDCTVKKCVALTFDDGPGPYTDKLLGYLKAAGTRATFFTVGRSVNAMPDVVRREVAAGHTVGVHTWSHPDLTRLPADQAAAEIQKSIDAVKTTTGTTPTLLRPPYGAFVKGKTPSDGLAVIQWDVDTEDWKNRSTPITTQRAIEGAHRGAIILMHDIHSSSVEAVPGIIAALKAKGYTLVTVPELLGHPEPGAVYFNQ